MKINQGTYGPGHGKNTKHPSSIPVYDFSSFSFNSQEFILSIRLYKQGQWYLNSVNDISIGEKKIPLLT